MSNSFTPRTRCGSDTRSFYSSRNKRRDSAGQRIRHLGHVSTEIQSYAAGEDLLEHVSVPLTENDSETDEDNQTLVYLCILVKNHLCLHFKPYW